MSLIRIRSGANGEHTSSSPTSTMFWKNVNPMASWVPMWKKTSATPHHRCRRGRNAMITEAVSRYIVPRKSAQPTISWWVKYDPSTVCWLVCNKLLPTMYEKPEKWNALSLPWATA